ncbi:MAG: hypothetical protein IK117_02040 [Bacteroidales bacterium]|nr:hypothetical protein [Bacteroidales bacterium]
MKKLLILLSAVLIFAGCKKEEEQYEVKTQGDFSGEAYTFGACTILSEEGVSYAAWMSMTPYTGYDCFIAVLPDYQTFENEKANYSGKTEKATYIMKAKKLYSVKQWEETEGENLSVNKMIVTWYESISKSEYDKLWAHYNEPRQREIQSNENGGRTRITLYDEAEKIKVVR